MQELLGRDVMGLKEAAARYGLAFSTVKRWARVGLVGPTGERIRLPVTRVGGRLWVSVGDVKSFIERLNREPELATAM